MIATSPYVSDSLAGSANQSWFEGRLCNGVMIGRSYYRLFAGGEHPYALLFTGSVDSTFADGKHSRTNDALDYTLHTVRVGLCDDCGMNTPTEPADFQQLFFQGIAERRITANEAVFSDPITLCAHAGQYLCVETVFSGSRIPCHPEIQIPAFRREGGQWVPSKELPVPGMIGCIRPVECHVGFLGDSITQGIGTPSNSYAHWNAVLAQELGQRYAYWNLGIGYGRASDAALDGQWLQKASQMQIVTVCFGVNDILQGATADQTVEHLHTILTTLQGRGVRVLLQTIPPFNMSGKQAEEWSTANERIRTELFPLADAVFDAAELLKKSDVEPLAARFGGHPNMEGCTLWAEALAPVMKALLASMQG